MDDLTRRQVLGGVSAVAGVVLPGLLPPAKGDDKRDPEAEEKLDRQRVIAAGFTEAEADCWLLLNRAAGKFFELPKLHPMDDHEIAHAVHALQYRLMMRPAYRKYKEVAKGEKK